MSKTQKENSASDTKNIITYLTEFLVSKNFSELIHYGTIENVSENCKIIIIPSNFWSNYGLKSTLPILPLNKLPDTDIPFLFGESKLIKKDDKIILYADLIASTYYLLSRYEEIIKPESRDQHGRFLAKDSIIFQAGYGQRPLVDEWGLYLRNLLRECNIYIPKEKQEFSKIYLTHDVDIPFKFCRIFPVLKQIFKNVIHYGKPIENPLRIYLFDTPKDPYYTFPKIIEYDKTVEIEYTSNIVTKIYFLIAKGNYFTKQYCNIKFRKYKKLLKELINSNATLGLHVSYEGGRDSSKIKKEIERLSSIIPTTNLNSRHHFLRWCEPEQITDMENAGITDDFTLGYADCVGFRVGTCRPYKFINPITKSISSITIHPMEIMECTLEKKQYMGLDFEQAFNTCCKVIDQVKKYSGELVLLWHNTSFCNGSYHEKLYSKILGYINNSKDDI